MSLKGLRVLVVEDETAVTAVIEEFLSDLGCRIVGHARDLEDAVHKANTLDIDVAMVDLNLAGKLSYPVADALRARRIPFFFATSYGLMGLPQGFNGVAVLAKPFGFTQLSDALYVATKETRLGGGQFESPRTVIPFTE